MTDSDLIAKLREHGCTCKVLRQAAARIAELEALLEEARGVLEPFARERTRLRWNPERQAHDVVPPRDDDMAFAPDITHGHIRKARAFLSKLAPSSAEPIEGKVPGTNNNKIPAGGRGS